MGGNCLDSLENWKVQIKSEAHRMRKYTNIKIPMRDGKYLSTIIFLPAGSGPFPVILERTCYVISLGCSRANLIRLEAKYWNEQGYAYVIQDVRGRGDSQGEFMPYVHDAADGADTINWIAAQDWCDGKIGTYGQSYSAYTALAPLKESVPALKAVFNSGIPGIWGKHRYGYICNGILNSWHIRWRYQVAGRQAQSSSVYSDDLEDDTRIDWNKIKMHLPVRGICREVGQNMDEWLKLTCIEEAEQLFKQLRFDDIYETAAVPMMHVTGWLDLFEPTISNYVRFSSRSGNQNKQFLMVGPWTHFVLRNPTEQVINGVNFGDDIVVDMYEVKRRFFDSYVKGGGDFSEFQPTTKIYNVAEREWHENIDVAAWYREPKNSKVYFFTGGEASPPQEDGLLSLKKPEKEQHDEFIYDPNAPIFSPLEDQEADCSLYLNWMQKRDDVLTYSTDTLDTDVPVSGKPRLQLFLGSDCPDTDFIIIISDVFPDGAAMNLNNMHAFRMRYRNSLIEPHYLKEGDVYKLDFYLDAMYYTFFRGHKIRIQIQSSYLDFFFRSLNTGKDDYGTTEIRTAHNRLYHGAGQASKLIIPGAAK
jgi:hypothetical protein